MMPANFIGREELGGTPKPRRPGRTRTAKDLPRRALLYLGGLLLIGVVATLAITGHTNGWVELTPLAISGLGLVAIGNVLYEPDRSARGLLWLTSALIAIGGCYGILVHIDEIFGATADVGLEVIAPVLFIVASVLMVFGSLLEHSPESENEEVDSLIARALEELDGKDG